MGVGPGSLRRCRPVDLVSSSADCHFAVAAFRTNTCPFTALSVVRSVVRRYARRLATPLSHGGVSNAFTARANEYSGTRRVETLPPSTGASSFGHGSFSNRHVVVFGVYILPYTVLSSTTATDSDVRVRLPGDVSLVSSRVFRTVYERVHCTRYERVVHKRRVRGTDRPTTSPSRPVVIFRHGSLSDGRVGHGRRVNCIYVSCCRRRVLHRLRRALARSGLPDGVVPLVSRPRVFRSTVLRTRSLLALVWSSRRSVFDGRRKPIRPHC